MAITGTNSENQNMRVLVEELQVAGSDVTALLDGITATASEINLAADLTGQAQLLTATGAVAAATRYLSLSHATVVIAATMVATEHRGLFIIGDTSASGTVAHTVTLTGGTWNGTATIATLNAPGETLVVFFDDAGAGTIIANIGAVALS